MKWSDKGLFEWVPCPANNFEIDWNRLFTLFPILEELREVPQDPVYHREGDVWTHTRMVVEELAADNTWHARPEPGRSETWIAALLHDIGKKSTTRVHSNGSVSSPNHAMVGSRMARVILWKHEEIDIPFEARERIVNYVRYHGLPVWAMEKRDAKMRVLLTSQQISNYNLYLLARSDVKGRICDDKQQMLGAVEMFQDFCSGFDCLLQPFPFADDYTRFLYARGQDRDPRFPAYDETTFEVILMSGLPGTGKDTWIDEHGGGQPVVSLDQIRDELGIPPDGNQGKVIQTAKERAKEHLRNQEPFIWNATNITRSLRKPLIDLFTRYNARVKFVYTECSYPELLKRNREREKPVPEKVLDKLISKWEVVDCFEGFLDNFT